MVFGRHNKGDIENLLSPSLREHNQWIRNKLNSERIKNLEERLDVDYLTGLFNKKKFDEELVNATLLYERNKVDLSLILWDINYFKLVNDKLGHDFGDKVLRKVGDLFKNNFRQSDKYFRLSGDEFAVLIYADSSGALEVVKKVNEIFKNEISSKGKLKKLNFGLSASVVGFKEFYSSYNTQGSKQNNKTVSSLLFKLADNLLYEAKEISHKNGGKSSYVNYVPEKGN